MKIVVLDGYALNPGDISWDEIRTLGEMEIYDRTPKDLIIERAGDAEIILLNKTPLSRDILEKLDKVRFVGVLATGYDVVDTIAARERGILVTNIPAYSTESVAQLVFALLLEICHHVGDHNRSVQSGEWAASKDYSYWKYPLMELSGKTLGIIGVGRIGQSASAIAQAFGLHVVAFNRSRNSALENDRFRYVTLDQLYAQSDIITLHCPLSEETRGLINAESIAKMKNGVILINTSRGGLVVESDLAAALHAGKVYGAGVDVVSVEPIRSDNPLLGAPNCIITPHIGWAPVEARKRLMTILAENIQQFLAGTPVNVVNGN